MTRSPARIRISTWIIAAFLVLAFIFGLIVTNRSTELRSKATASTLPITGTFLIADTPNDAITPLFEEMKQTGIDTVIFLASGGLGGPCKPDPPAFTEQYYFTANSWYTMALREAKRLNFTIYFGLVNVDANTCMPFWEGTENDTNTYMGRILDYSARLVTQVKNTVAAEGWSWNDPQFAGFYIMEKSVMNFTDATNADTVFFRNLVTRIKTNAPNKKVLMSPWLEESYTITDVTTGYRNLYDTGIDIIAPQDSMGTAKVTSYQKSAAFYTALSTVASGMSNKTAWANIETFKSTSSNGTIYEPSTLTRVSQQIAAARPHVSKTITWIYQHTLTGIPQLDDRPGTWTHQYTAAQAAARKLLRQEYLSLYSPEPTATNTVAPSVTTTPHPTATPSLIPASPTPTSVVTPSPTPVPGESPLSSPADLTGNGTINIVDFTLFMAGWFTHNKNTADLNGDDRISVIDYTIFMNEWWAYNNRQAQ